MERKGQGKRKKESSSGDEILYTPKHSKQGGPVDDGKLNISVSDILSTANSVLFDDSDIVFLDNMPSHKGNSADSDVNIASNVSKSKTASKVQSQTDSEVIAYLKKIDSKIDIVEKKLQTLDSLEKKVDGFEREIKKLWSRVDKLASKTEDKLQNANDRIDHLEFNAGERYDDIKNLEKENDKLKDTISYLQSQTMRNNLVFCGVNELPNEKPADTEGLVRQFLVDKLKMAQEYAQSVGIERAHRMGVTTDNARANGARKIVCKFTLYKDRENVRRKRTELQGTRYYIHEQFPPEVVAKRRRLVPKMKQAKQEGKTSWISYDTLFVDGKPVKGD